jgi:shikimate kinase
MHVECEDDIVEQGYRPRAQTVAMGGGTIVHELEDVECSEEQNHLKLMREELMYLMQRCIKNEQIGMGKREGHCGLTLSGRSFLLASAAIFSF